MAKLEWDKTGERYYEAGVERVALFVMDSATTTGYGNGVAWNGCTGITESPSGAEANDLWADNGKYASLRSSEQYGGTIEAYTYPEEFGVCDGSATIAPGIHLGQQVRKAFGLAYITKVGNDTDMTDHAEKLHIVYNATASPSERSYETINDSPDAMTLSWEFDTTPVQVEGYKPTSHIEISSAECDPAAWTAIINMVYGTDSTEPTLPLPSTIIEQFGPTYTYTLTASEPSDWDDKYYEYYTKYGSTYTAIPKQDSAPTWSTGKYYKRTTAS